MIAARLIIVVALGVLLAGAIRGYAQPPLRVIAVSGQDAIDTPARFSEFSVPMLGSSGQLAFKADLSGAAVPNDWGIWSGPPDQLRLVARMGDLVQSLPQGLMLGSDRTNLLGVSRSGDVLFRSAILGDDRVQGDWALLAGRWGTLKPVARKSEPAPGAAAGEVFRDITGGAFSADGLVAVNAELTRPGVATVSSVGVWVGKPSTLVQAARTGAPAPGGAPAEIFVPVSPSEPDVALYPVSLRDDGQVALRGYIAASGTTADPAVWAGPPGALRLVARRGHEAPGLAYGLRFTSMEIGAGRSAGVVLSAHVAPAGGQECGAGIWTWDDRGLRLVMSTSTTAPGLPDHQFRAFGEARVNASGRVLVNATAAPPGNDAAVVDGLWAGRPGDVRLLTRAGAPAPGGDAGEVFQSFGNLLLDDTGSFIFRTRTTGPSITQGNDEGLWAGDPAGRLRRLVREGELIEVREGDLRQVSRIAYDDRGLAGGQLALRLSFADGSEAIVLATVPDPAAVSLLGLASAVLALKRNHACAEP